MKIVNLEQFRNLPNGTVFSKYEPYCFEDIKCKADTWEHDFLFQTLTNDIDCSGWNDFELRCKSMECGNSMQLSVDASERDGMFYDYQLFAIYEKEDIEQLINKLNRCLKEAY